MVWSFFSNLSQTAIKCQQPMYSTITYNNPFSPCGRQCLQSVYFTLYLRKIRDYWWSMKSSKSELTSSEIETIYKRTGEAGHFHLAENLFFKHSTASHASVYGRKKICYNNCNKSPLKQSEEPTGRCKYYCQIIMLGFGSYFLCLCIS